MSYDISLKVKVQDVDKYINVADGGNCTWNVRELIEKASGWEIKNEENNGTAEDMIPMLKQGIANLSERPNDYKQYEASNGWGTVESTLRFFRGMLDTCEEHPYAYVFVH